MRVFGENMRACEVSMLRDKEGLSERIRETDPTQVRWRRR